MEKHLLFSPKEGSGLDTSDYSAMGMRQDNTNGLVLPRYLAKSTLGETVRNYAGQIAIIGAAGLTALTGLGIATTTPKSAGAEPITIEDYQSTSTLVHPAFHISAGELDPNKSSAFYWEEIPHYRTLEEAVFADNPTTYPMRAIHLVNDTHFEQSGDIDLNGKGNITIVGQGQPVVLDRYEERVSAPTWGNVIQNRIRAINHTTTTSQELAFVNFFHNPRMADSSIMLGGPQEIKLIGYFADGTRGTSQGPSSLEEDINISTTTLDNCVLYKLNAGAIINGTGRVDNCLFVEDNYGIYLENQANVNLTNCTYAGNRSDNIYFNVFNGTSLEEAGAFFPVGLTLPPSGDGFNSVYGLPITNLPDILKTVKMLSSGSGGISSGSIRPAGTATLTIRDWRDWDYRLLGDKPKVTATELWTIYE